MQLDKESIEAQLQHFGQYLKRQIQQTAFSWKGFGDLLLVDGAVVFQPAQRNHLAPVAAHKIIREGAYHDVLVGEKEMHSSDVSYISDNARPRRSYATLIGWIIVLLAAAFIVYYLLQHGFHPFASGLQQKTFSLNSNIDTPHASLTLSTLLPIL